MRYVDRDVIVEKPTYQVKEIRVEVPYEVEKVVYRDREVPIYSDRV